VSVGEKKVKWHR